MITLEEFKEVLSKVIETQKYFDDFEKITKLEIFETPIYENYFSLVDTWLKAYVKNEFIDTVNAYLYPEDNWEINSYDRPEHPLEIYYKDGAVNKLGTIEQLYTYIKENDGFCTNC